MNELGAVSLISEFKNSTYSLFVSEQTAYQTKNEFGGKRERNFLLDHLRWRAAGALLSFFSFLGRKLIGRRHIHSLDSNRLYRLARYRTSHFFMKERRCDMSASGKELTLLRILFVYLIYEILLFIYGLNPGNQVWIELYRPCQ